MSADYEMHSALMGDLLDEAYQLLREARDLLQEQHDEQARLKRVVTQLAAEAMGYLPDPEVPGRFLSQGLAGWALGISMERVNELLEPFGFPGLRMVAA